MSVSLAVGNLKSKADLLRKEMDYRKLLRLQARLNAAAEKVAQLPVEPPISLEAPTEKEQDLNETRLQVINRFTPILGDKETKVLLGRYFRAPSDLRLFHSLMDEFIPILRYDRPLNANYLFNIYTRWVQRKKAQMEGSGSLQPTIQTEMDRLGNGIKGIILNSGLSPTDTLRYVRQTEDAMRAFDVATLEKMAGRVYGGRL